MGLGTFVHHIGTLLLLVATVLLIVVDVTSPVVNSLSMMRVDVGAGENNFAGFRQPGLPSEVTFCTFGFCYRGVGDSDSCSRARVGYNPAQIMETIDGNIDFGSAAEATTKGLTRVMVLHPVATVLCFIAFLLCLGAGIIGSMMATVISLLAFLITLIAMICNFASFSIVKNKINDAGRDRASWGSAIWCMLAAAIFTLLAAGIVCITCCAGRSKKRRQAKKESFNGDAPVRRRRFWQKREAAE